VRLRFAGAAVVLAANVSCSRTEVPPPPRLPAQAEWRPECRAVRDERHQACYGPGWEAQRAREAGRFHFYQVSVERTQGTEPSLVLFLKRLGVDEVDPKLLRDTPEGDIVRYDAAARSVRFDLGREPIVVPLDASR
jgi:hypothetical protein